MYWKNTTNTLTLKTNDRKVSGVLHSKQSAQHYQLRRYLPSPELAPLVEQFWLVNWDLQGQPVHTQKNLPDPNMHLVINNQDSKVLGPVSKKYHYSMQGKGRIIGVKFNLGVLIDKLPCVMRDALDKEFELNTLFPLNPQKWHRQLLSEDNDETIVQYLTAELLGYLPTSNKLLPKVQKLVEQIKTNNDINRVEQLAELSHTSIRNIQRLFKIYVGLSPKWLIRKYRLQQAMAILEENDISLTELATRLDYSDQSHLIRDFNEFLNITPKQYAVALKQGINLNQ